MRAINLLLLFTFILIVPISQADPPVQSGPNVFRFEWPNYWLYTDGDLVAIHGADIPASCEDNEFVLDTWYAKFINIPADEYVSVAHVKGEDIDTQIYPSDLIVFFENGTVDLFATCVNFFSNPDLYEYPLAAGTVDATFTGNNVASPGATNPRRTVFHMSVHGVLDAYGPGGDVTGRVLFRGGFNCNWIDSFDPQYCNYSIKLD